MKGSVDGPHPDLYGQRPPQIADGYAHAFPEGNTPLHILARMTEELGEVASAVAHLERHGSKVAKLGEPSVTHLADEIEDLIHCAISLVRYYQAEDQFDRAVLTTLDALQTTGHFDGGPPPGRGALPN